MEYNLTIPERLPGINELIAANRTHIQKGAKLKRDSQELVSLQIRQQLKNVKIKAPVIISYTFYESNTKRDLDNISGFAHKVIQDALVECGVLENDGWKNILGFTDSFHVDKYYPRIEVFIEEVIE